MRDEGYVQYCIFLVWFLLNLYSQEQQQSHLEKRENIKHFSAATPGQLLVQQRGFCSSGNFSLSVGSWLCYTASFLASCVQQHWSNIVFCLCNCQRFQWQIGIFQEICGFLFLPWCPFWQRFFISLILRQRIIGFAGWGCSLFWQLSLK